MAICNFLLYCVVLFFSCYSNKPYVYGAREVANHHHVVQMRSLVPASTCSSTNKGSRGLRIHHRYGPCSPLGQENSSPNYHQIFLHDQSRVNFINSNRSNKYSVDNYGEESKLPISDTSIGGGNFVVNVGFGTPKKELKLILDTGSDYTWIQCKPCSVCQDDIYDPKSSSTFSKFPCSAGSCNYKARYQDKTYSIGYYVQDTLTLSSSEVYPKFVFGCGQDISKGFGKAAGMLGIGRDSTGDHSFISQFAKNFSNIFCYCLPAKESSSGYLLFGEDALKTCQTNKFTPLLKIPEYYFVKLIGITFGGQRLNISSYLSSSSSSDTILDSGTVITRLPRSIYSRISSAFNKSMSKYPPAKSFEVLDTCYNLEGVKEVSIPKMILHFSNADVELGQSAVIWGQSDAQVCLAFAPKEDESKWTIIGNHQQRALNILYDIQKGRVQFGAGSCAK